MAVIKDGSAGYTAAVNDQNQLEVHAVTEGLALHSSGRGEAWNLNTDNISITTGAASLMYLKNTSDAQFIIESIIMGIAEGTFVSTEFPYIHIHKNPTGGTIIDNAVRIPFEQNRNFSFNDSFGGDVYVGVDGDTDSGGVGMGQFIINKTGRTIIPVNFVLPKQSGFSMHLNMIGTGTTNVYAAVVGYFHNDTHI